MRIILFSVLVVICLVSIGYFSLRSYFISQAESKAERITDTVKGRVGNTNTKEALLAITSEVHHEFSSANPGSSLILRLRPYLTSSILPELIRFPNGVIETVMKQGLCDNAARNLQFVLGEIGYESVQWDMVQRQSGHSAVLVYLSEDKTALLDPFYGTVSYVSAENELISPVLAQERLRNGAVTADIFVSLSQNTKLSFYEGFEETWMAAQGEELIIPSVIPDFDQDRLVLGELNGRSDDVVAATGELQMTPYWGYVGHRYNRSWIRVLRAEQDVEVQFTLEKLVDDSVLTSEPLPEIDGKHMRWQLKAGEEISFFDGRAKRSLSRMNSFIGVDQIVLHRLN